jgi:hypothetical protein
LRNPGPLSREQRAVLVCAATGFRPEVTLPYFCHPPKLFIMDVLPSSSFGPDADSKGGPELDPRLKPTPDYGALGPGSDIAKLASGPQRASAGKPANPAGPVIAIALGMALAGLFAAIGTSRRAAPTLANQSSSRVNQPASPKDSRQLDRMIPQKQAETLLELAVGHSDGAVDQISSRVEHWQGKVQ